MFYYIKGALAFKEASCAVIEASGVGYRMTVSQTTYNSLPAVGGNAKLFTHLSVREDGIELFGFATPEELNAFKMLIGVSGVGPKVAVSVLSQFSPERFAVIVASEDAKSLAKANGVGSKTAARIVLELKDKLSVLGSAVGSPAAAEVASVGESSGEFADAVEALMAIGYTRSEILTALRGVDTSNMSLEEIFKSATKRLIR